MVPTKRAITDAVPVDAQRDPPDADESRPTAILELLGGFRLTRRCGEVQAPLSAQRLLALLALSGRSLRRSYVAGNLWADSSESHGAGSLRSALWRIRQIDPNLLTARADCLRLNDSVEVDVRTMSRLCATVGRRRAVHNRCRADRLRGRAAPRLVRGLGAVRTRADSPAQNARTRGAGAASSAAGRHGEAVEAAIAAVQCEVLRESGNHVLIEVHLAEGNVSEAVRHHDIYRSLLRRELGIEPSPELSALVSPLTRC